MLGRAMRLPRHLRLLLHITYDKVAFHLGTGMAFSNGIKHIAASCLPSQPHGSLMPPDPDGQSPSTLGHQKDAGTEIGRNGSSAQ